VCKKIIDYYKEAVHWKRNLFNLPSNHCGRAFTSELTRFFSAFAEASSMESISLTAAMLLPILILQKPSGKLSSKVIHAHIQRRLGLWGRGDFDSLMTEGRTIQTRLSFCSQPNHSQLSRSFSNLMFTGRIKAALRLLSDSSTTVKPLSLDDVLPSGKSVRQVLEDKHPSNRPVAARAVLPCDPLSVNAPIIFEEIDACLIRKMALRCTGAHGPSGLTASEWKQLCSSFGTASDDLCSAVAAATRRLCVCYVDPSCLSAFVACRLIALDKCPGVRPIGIGETVRRIMSKAILAVLKFDILQAAGCSQLCAGQDSGCEAAIHAVRELFTCPDTEAVLLIDASNAFNSLARQTTLLNIQQLCPPFSIPLINTYRSPVELFVGGESIFSTEGTTQGDPMGMPMYALGVLPLIHKLDAHSVTQIWYADDACACGSLQDLRHWYDDLVSLGPSYGYFINASKCHLILKNTSTASTDLFQGTGVTVCRDGRRYLGSAIGTDEFVEAYISNQVQTWHDELSLLTDIAKSQPHAAFSAYIHGFESRWTFLCRTTPSISHLFADLDSLINTRFLPLLTEQPPTNDVLRQLLSLPIREGGLGLMEPSKVADYHYSNSVKVTAPLVSLLTHKSSTSVLNVHDETLAIKQDVHRTNRKLMSDKFDATYTQLTTSLKKCVDMAREKGASSWLSAIPIRKHGYALHKCAFTDAICFRYGWRPANLPTNCVCGKPFTIEHSLSCSFGGFPTIRHNEIRDVTANLLTQVCSNVQIEPQLQPLSGESLSHRTSNSDDHARLDISAKGFWNTSHERAFVDVRVFNPLAKSYINQSLSSSYRKNENEKKRAYDERVRNVEHGTFTPLVFSVAGGMGPIATTFYKRLASLLADKLHQTYNQTIRWLRCNLSFSLLRSMIMCLRGARSSSGKPQLAASNISLAVSEARL